MKYFDSKCAKQNGFDPKSGQNLVPRSCMLVDEWPEAAQSHSAVGFEVAESPLESRRNFTGDPSPNSEVHLWSL